VINTSMLDIPSIKKGDPTNVIWAKGPLPPAAPALIYHGTTRYYGQINFQEGTITVAGTSKYIIAHAVLMALAWGFVLPLGVIVARFGKERWPKTWFRYHRANQLLGLCMILAAFIIAMVKLKTPTTGLPGVHRALGITLFTLAWLQPVMAAKRPQNDSPNAPRFFWARAHWWIGRVAIIMAYVQIPIGMMILPAPNAYVILYVCGVVVAIALYALIQLRWDWVHFKREKLGEDAQFFRCCSRGQPGDKGDVVFHGSSEKNTVGAVDMRPIN